jgi:hypothetical protein
MKDPRPDDLAGRRFHIEVQAEPANVPTINRLRRLLKCLLRVYGMRCLGVSQVPDDAPLPEPPSDGPPTTTTES